MHSLGNCPLGVVSILGKYRTGKSYLVNKILLQNKKKGFKVGPTVNACTKGLWLWDKTVEANQGGAKHRLLIIDTEGFGGVQVGQNHDTRIFLFSILLSSLFVYNSVGAINENAIEQISLVINLAKRVKREQFGVLKDLNEEQIRENFPHFLWVLRDFSLKLVDKNNKRITPEQYLEQSLKKQPGLGDKVHRKNQVRKLITHFFRTRDCVTLIRPVEEEAKLQKL